MTLLTTNADQAWTPDDIGELVVRDVRAASVAARVATVARTSATTWRAPVVAADPTAEWVAEGDEITPSDATLGEVAVTPSKVAGLSIISRELAEDSTPEAAEVIGQGLARDIARKVDAAFFGNLSAPAPAGLGSIPSPGAVDAGASWDDLDAFEQAALDAEQVGGTLTAFVANPADALTLVTLKEQTGSNRALLAADPTQAGTRTLAGRPLYVSPDVTAGTIWGIPQRVTFLVVRNDVRVEVSADAYFSSDRVAVKATMRVGFAFPHHDAVQKITLSA